MQIVISGGSSIAEYLVPSILSDGHSITIIESEKETFDHLAEVLPQEVMLVEGDGCDTDTQLDAGVDRADLFIALMGHDETNYVACQMAMKNCEVDRCIAVLNNPKNEPLFRKASIEPISSTVLIEKMIKQESTLGDIRMIFYSQEGDIIMIETRLPKKMRHRDKIMVGDITLERSARILAVVRDGDFYMVNNKTVLRPGDRIVAAVKADAEDYFREIIQRL